MNKINTTEQTIFWQAGHLRALNYLSRFCGVTPGVQVIGASRTIKILTHAKQQP